MSSRWSRLVDGDWLEGMHCILIDAEAALPWQQPARPAVKPQDYETIDQDPGMCALAIKVTECCTSNLSERCPVCNECVEFWDTISGESAIRPIGVMGFITAIAQFDKIKAKKEIALKNDALQSESSRVKQSSRRIAPGFSVA